MSNTHKLSLSVQYATEAKNLPTRPQFRRWVRAALHPQGVRRRVPGSIAATLPLQRDVQIVLRLVDESEGRTLNKNFSGKDYATNVLTFVHEHESVLHGDLALCAPVVAKEAREQHKDLHAHYAHLTIHATLHLQGYDHKNDTDATAMEASETAILHKLGYASPY